MTVTIFGHVSPYLQVQCTRRNPLLEARNMKVTQCLLRSFGDHKDNLIAAMSCSLPQVTNVAATKAQSITHAVPWVYGLRRSQTKLHYGLERVHQLNYRLLYSVTYNFFDAVHLFLNEIQTYDYNRMSSKYSSGY